MTTVPVIPNAKLRLEWCRPRSSTKRWSAKRKLARRGRNTWKLGAYSINPNNGNSEPVIRSGQPWFYEADWHGNIDGVDTGDDCKGPGTIGHKYLAQALVP
ncbi:MAG: hypothetical protein M3R53_10135 [Candidatus Eremiobacteraeota bacterium]|nr:hypothetical protein [Candidatus Eremiobacteraeota bacterium]